MKGNAGNDGAGRATRSPARIVLVALALAAPLARAQSVPASGGGAHTVRLPVLGADVSFPAGAASWSADVDGSLGADRLTERREGPRLDIELSYGKDSDCRSTLARLATGGAQDGARATVEPRPAYLPAGGWYPAAVAYRGGGGSGAVVCADLAGGAPLVALVQYGGPRLEDAGGDVSDALAAVLRAVRERGPVAPSDPSRLAMPARSTLGAGGDGVPVVQRLGAVASHVAVPGGPGGYGGGADLVFVSAGVVDRRVGLAWGLLASAGYVRAGGATYDLQLDAGGALRLGSVVLAPLAGLGLDRALALAVAPAGAEQVDAHFQGYLDAMLALRLSLGRVGVSAGAGVLLGWRIRETRALASLELPLGDHAASLSASVSDYGHGLRLYCAGLGIAY